MRTPMIGLIVFALAVASMTFWDAADRLGPDHDAVVVESKAPGPPPTPRPTATGTNIPTESFSCTIRARPLRRERPRGRLLLRGTYYRATTVSGSQPSTSRQLAKDVVEEPPADSRKQWRRATREEEIAAARYCQED